jgi:hypothetical protein
MNQNQLRDDTEPRSVDQQQACSAAFANGEAAFRRSMKMGLYDQGMATRTMPEDLEQRKAWWDGFFGAAELVFKTGKLSPPNDQG